MLDPHDARWRRAVWLAAVGAAVGGPVGYIIGSLTGGNPLTWAGAVPFVYANIAAQIASPGWLTALAIGTLGAAFYVGTGISTLMAIGAMVINDKFFCFGLGYQGRYTWAAIAATAASLLIAWWATREEWT